MQRAVTATGSGSPACCAGPGRASPSAVRAAPPGGGPQPLSHGVCEVGLHLSHVAHDAFRIELLGAQRGDARHRFDVIGKREDRRLDRLDHRLTRRARGQGAAKPLQPGVVVGEQKVVLGGEVPIKRSQRHAGVGGDLFGAGVLDALGQKRTSAAWRNASRVRSLRAVWGARGMRVNVPQRATAAGNGNFDKTERGR